jgi:hypothetical protein
MLNIYLIKRPSFGYEEHTSFVASSESADLVIFVHPDSSGNYAWDAGRRAWVDQHGCSDRGVWCSPSDLLVEQIGTTEDNVPQVYCSGFNP